MKRKHDDSDKKTDFETNSTPLDSQSDDAEHVPAESASALERIAPGSDSTPLDAEIPIAHLTRIDITESSVIITVEPAGSAPTTVVRTSPDRSVIHMKRTRPASDLPLPHVRINKVAFEKVRETVGKFPAERGGIFVGPDPFCVEDFIFDRGSDSGRSVYYPDVAYLNEILERDHEPHGRVFIGVVHSHPNGFWRPSGDESWGDVKAARNNLLSRSNADLPALFIPIVESAATSGTFVLHPFVMLRRDLRVHPARFEVID